MAAPSFHRVLDYPCRLVSGATDLTAAYPYGGTEMGFTDRVELLIEADVHPIIAAERPQSPVVDVIVCSETWTASCVVRDADEDALYAAIPNSAFGAISGRLSITNPGSFLPGTGLLASRSKRILFVPETMVQGNEDTHDMAILYKSLLYYAERVPLPMRLGQERPWAIRFWSVPDANGRTGYVGRKADAEATV